MGGALKGVRFFRPVSGSGSGGSGGGGGDASGSGDGSGNDDDDDDGDGVEVCPGGGGSRIQWRAVGRLIGKVKRGLL